MRGLEDIAGNRVSKSVEIRGQFKKSFQKFDYERGERDRKVNQGGIGS